MSKINQCSDVDHSQIIGGEQMQTIVKLLEGMQSNYWGDISPHPPRVSAPLVAVPAPANNVVEACCEIPTCMK